MENLGVSLKTLAGDEMQLRALLAEGRPVLLIFLRHLG
jgi:hypothetical protein